MFEAIKKWFKRPIVINFTVESLNSGSGLNVIKTDSHITPEVAEAVRKAWTEFGNFKVTVLGPHAKLEQLSDADLRAIGLIRADFGVLEYPGPSTISQEGIWLLDKCERAIKLNPNSDIAKYLKDSVTKDDE